MKKFNSFNNFNDLVDKIVIIFGWTFRAATISVIGYVSFNYFYKGNNIGDIPLSQITLNDLFSNIFSIASVFGCIFWFFNFPKDEYYDEENKCFKNPYEAWASGGGIVLLILFLLYWYTTK